MGNLEVSSLKSFCGISFSRWSPHTFSEGRWETLSRESVESSNQLLNTFFSSPNMIEHYVRQMLLLSITTMLMLLVLLMRMEMERTTSLTLGSVQEQEDAKNALEVFRERATRLLEAVCLVKHSNANTARRLYVGVTRFFSAQIVPRNS